MVCLYPAGPGSPFTYEKLCPVLGAIKCKNYAEVLDIGEAVLRNGGMGHTSSLFCAEDRMDVIQEYNSRMPAGRVLVDMPGESDELVRPRPDALKPRSTQVEP